jgi:hypothetical protein
MTLTACAFLMLRRPAVAASIPHLGAFSFKVLNADGAEVIGHSQYELSRGGNDLLIGRGSAYFQNGERDVEYDTLKPRPNLPPAMLTLEHRFFNADGSMQRTITADFHTGEASCTRYENGVARTENAKLDFTDDSYGGSAVVLPLEHYLAQGATGPFKLHALNCIPEPRLIAVEARIRKPSRWSLYPGLTVEADVKPDLGWLDVVVGPFLPELRAWFDPSNEWTLAGAEFARYFRGPRVLLVREVPAEFRSLAQPPKGN